MKTNLVDLPLFVWCMLTLALKSLWAEVSLHWGQQFLTWCLVSLLTAGQVQLKSSYGGSSRTVKLGSSFDFSWNFSGDLLKVEWGTKQRDRTVIDVLLFVLSESGRLIPDVSQYDDRRFGSWNQQSPDQVKFTLNPIKGVDNQVFIFRFVPRSGLASDVYDTVQLIVKGKNFYWSTVISLWRVEWSFKVSK